MLLTQSTAVLHKGMDNAMSPMSGDILSYMHRFTLVTICLKWFIALHRLPRLIFLLCKWRCMSSAYKGFVGILLQTNILILNVSMQVL